MAGWPFKNCNHSIEQSNNMKRYDDIVVGSGISGLSLALLLGMNGRKVLLLEKASRIGGGMLRFCRQGIPLDTGFHFTGGLNNKGLLFNMLNILGINDYLRPVYLSQDSNRFILEAEQSSYDMPTGIDNISDKMKEYFPSEKNAIDRYFEMVQFVCSRTISMDLHKLSLSANSLNEDFVSLADVLNQLTANRSLKALLSGYCMCHGVKPSEISFASHSRVCFNLFESVATIENGGDALIAAFQDRFKNFNIDIMCKKHICECIDIKDDRIGHFVLNTGEEVACDNCILTIHPREILKILPQDYLSKAFIDRIEAFEPSAGFFLVYSLAEVSSDKINCKPTVNSLFPITDLDQLLDPDYTGVPALGIVKNSERVNGKSYTILTAFEPSFPKHVEAWKDSRTGKRPPKYMEYKQKRVNHMKKRILGFYPEYRNSFKVLDAASILTFRDYLNSPYGSAYGIKQKVGQYNLFGKLPLRNVYAAGQSAVLPGALGAMMSSFILARSILSKEAYSRFIEQKLCN